MNRWLTEKTWEDQVRQLGRVSLQVASPGEYLKRQARCLSAETAWKAIFLVF